MSSNQKPWEHAKQAGEADPLAARFVESISYDTRLYPQDIRGSIAHARMLRHVGLIGEEDLTEIERGLSEIEREIDEQGDAWPGWKVELEDVHMCIEAALIEKIGEPGRKLHTGRSRNDQVALDIKLWIEDATDSLDESFDILSSAFVQLAERDGRIVMPSYTHLQRAQPVLVGGELLAWLDAFEDTEMRFVSPTSMEDNPLGSGAIAGSSLPLDRDFLNDSEDHSLPFIEPSPNSITATASRDAVIDFVYALSMTAMWLSRWAEQWIIYATTEFGFITLDPKYTTGSSMMPQKQNPDMLELIRGRCGGVYGHLMALLTMCKGLTIGYNRDLQEDKRHLFAAYDTVRDCLEMAARIVRTTRFNEDRIQQGLDRGFLDATSLAEYLVTKGVAFRTAHQHVGRLVRTCQERGLERLIDLPLSEMREVCDRIEGDVADWLGPENVVRRYQTHGNAGVSGFQQQLAEWKQRLQPDYEQAGEADAGSAAPARETAGGAEAQASGGGGDSPINLFNEPLTLTDADEALIEVYREQGRTLDDLPYTEEFERLHEKAAGGRNRVEVFHRLHNLRKAGKLPRIGRAKERPPLVEEKQAAVLSTLVAEHVGALSRRDQLPYTPAFDEIVAVFNSRTGMRFSEHQVWRIIAKLAK